MLNCVTFILLFTPDAASLCRAAWHHLHHAQHALFWAGIRAGALGYILSDLPFCTHFPLVAGEFQFPENTLKR